ncbi:hypothetical protein BsWGS_23277 [Bradybaena similaris]
MNFHKKPHLPIDRGWAWFIMIGAYVIILVANTLGRSLSIFLPDILELYNEPATVTTLAFGVSDLSWSVTNIAIPSLLLPRFSVRTLALWGATLHCFAVIALAYSPNIIMFNCLFGVFGCADGLMIVTSMIHLGPYFKKRLSFASAVVQIGGSTAMILAPRLAQFLKDTYGYQGALLILGGISFHCVTAAMLLWPVSMFGDRDESDSRSKNNIQELGNIHDMAIIIRANEEEEEDVPNEKSKFVDVIDFETKEINELNTTSDLKMPKYVDILKGKLQSEDKESAEIIPLSSGKSTPRSTSENTQNKLQILSSSLSDLELDVKVSNRSDNYSQNEYSISYPYDVIELDSNGVNREGQALYAKLEPSEGDVLNSSMEEHVCNLTALIQDGSENCVVSTPSVTSGGCCSLQKIKAYLSSSVLANPVAMMLIVTGMFSTPGGIMYLPVLALENGLSPDEVSWLLTIAGIGDILGKLAIGYFADLGCVRPIRIVCISQFTLGIVCQFTTFYKGFGLMAGMAVIFGMMNGVVQSLLATLVVEFLGLPYLAQVTSNFCMACGVSTFVINVAFGAIKDATGSFSGGFNLLGGMVLTDCVMLTLEPLFLRCRDKFSQQAKNSHSSGND